MDLLFIFQMIYEYGEPWWNDIDREKTLRTWETKICPSITFCTTNLTWTDKGTNSGVYGERLATNRLNHNRAKYRP
jgi:hypothetical protein